MMLHWLVDELLLDLLGHVLQEDHMPIVKQLLECLQSCFDILRVLAQLSTLLI